MHQVTIRVNGRDVTTLADIVPETRPVKMLIVAKTAAPVSVATGHYFQGRQGRMFWNRLKEWNLLDAPTGSFEDDALLDHGYGLTDIVKVPREYGSEPSDAEYRAGVARVLELVARLEPRVLMFVYKRTLDQILRLHFEREKKSIYGFNEDLCELVGSHVFVFPMPGTPCRSAEATAAMRELTTTLM